MEALAAGARGVIVGSAVVAIVERTAGDHSHMRAELSALMAALRPAEAALRQRAGLRPTGRAEAR